jgi:hypothetical protein
MKLYYSPAACSLATHIVAREAGLAIDLVKVDLASHKTETGEESYARTAAILWNLFGMADLVNAVLISRAINDAGIVFPVVIVPIYAVPRGFLIHSYSLIGLLKGTSKQPASANAAEIRAGA